MIGWLERGRAHGPVTRAAAHAQQHAGSLGRARQERRTTDDLDEAPLTAHLLEVLEEPRQPVVGAGARHAHLWTCVTKFEPVIENARIGQGLSRERGAQVVVVWAHRATHLYRRPVPQLQQLERLDGGAGHDDYGPAEKCFSSANVLLVPLKCWTSSNPIRTECKKITAPLASPNSRRAVQPAMG